MDTVSGLTEGIDAFPFFWVCSRCLGNEQTRLLFCPCSLGPRTSPPFSLTPRLSSVGDTLQQQAAWNWAGLLPCAALCFPACFWGLQMRPPVLRPHADGVAGRAAQSPVPE